MLAERRSFAQGVMKRGDDGLMGDWARAVLSTHQAPQRERKARMTRQYQPKTPPDTSKAPCYPSKRLDACYLCTRWRIAEPPEARQFVVIDATAALKDGVCQMFDARPAVRAYSEVDA